MRITFAVALLTAASAAVAQDGPRRPMMSDACRAEVVKICAPTGDRAAMRQCVMTNVAKFSAPCQAEMAKMQAMMQQRRENQGDGATPAPYTRDNSMSTPPADKPM